MWNFYIDQQRKRNKMLIDYIIIIGLSFVILPVVMSVVDKVFSVLEKIIK